MSDYEQLIIEIVEDILDGSMPDDWAHSKAEDICLRLKEEGLIVNERNTD